MHSIRKRLKKTNMEVDDTLQDIPSELKENIGNLDKSLSRLGESFGPLLSTPQTELQAKVRFKIKNPETKPFSYKKPHQILCSEVCFFFLLTCLINDYPVVFFFCFYFNKMTVLVKNISLGKYLR